MLPYESDGSARLQLTNYESESSEEFHRTSEFSDRALGNPFGHLRHALNALM